MGDIYNLAELAEFHNQRKQITLFKVSAYIRIKGNEEEESNKISNRYDRDDHDKTTLYRLQPDHLER